MNIDAKRFGLAGGIYWGASLFLLTLISSMNGYAKGFLEVFTGIYPGYNISLGGSVIGLIYGFLDGFVGSFLLIWVYNRLGKK